MAYEIQRVDSIPVAEHANAVCAICLRRGTLSRATALRTFGFARFYVCEGHAERARMWMEVCRTSDHYRRKVASV